MKATINGNASGIWTGMDGIEVEVISRKPNGYSTQVKVPAKPSTLMPDEFWPSIKRPWIPTSWLTFEEQI